MRKLETIWEFKTKNFRIEAESVEDYDVDLSFDETGEVRRKLENGDFVSFGVVVTVYANGSEMGESSLWGCIYEDFKSFVDHRGLRAQERKLQKERNQPNLRIGSYFSGMVREAITEARKSIEAIKSLPVHA
jgi:hypothetical protein